MAKPLKVRILKSTLNDGTVTYTAQYRMMGMWFSFNDIDDSLRKEAAHFFHGLIYGDRAPRPYAVWVYSDHCSTSDEIEGCKLLIKEYLDAVVAYNKNNDDKTVKKTEDIRL